DQTVRHAVADGVDIDEGIERDATTEMLRASRQRTDRQRPQLLALIPLKPELRRLARRAVMPLIGHHHPRREMLLERGKGPEGLVSERVALDEFDAGFGLAFRPRAVWRAGARLHVPIAAEGQIGRIERHRPGRAIAAEDQRAGIVAEQHAW